MDNDNEKALECYEKTIQINPKNEDAIFNKGLIKAEQNKLEEAKDCFKEVVKINNNYAYGYYALAMAYEAEGMLKDALSNYEKFLSLSTEESVNNSIQEKVDYLKNKLQPE